ncbi:MAG: YHS domain-containing protein [Methanobacteriota archaeon]
MGFLDKIRGKEGSTTKDPVCGMTVEPAKAAGSSAHGRATFYFCSPSCKSKFDADPHRYMGHHEH